MIDEDYVSFEVAKLLKEKGFDEQCTYMYDSQHKLYSTFEQCRQITRNNSDWIYYVGQLNVVPIAVPTHQMAMKWLREIYNINIEILLNGEGKWWPISCQDIKVRKEGEFYSTYEEAVEAALKYCLTKLI